MLFSAEFPWCLVFVQKSDFQEKSWKILQKSYFTRRPTEPEEETERGWELGSPPGGAARPGPRPPVMRLARPSPRPLLPPTYTLWLERSRGWAFFPDRLPLHRRHQKPRFGTRNSVLAPCGTGIWRKSSSPSSPTSLHQPSMTPPSICE
jgi:hypothetical protein